MLVYKINVIEELKEAGYNATRIRDERPISQNAMQKIRKGEMIGIKTLEQLCKLLDMQPGNIIKYVVIIFYRLSHPRHLYNVPLK